MKNVRGFTVVPALPEALKPLRELAYNLWWTWNPDAFQLFRRLDIDLWEELYHNPVRLLGRVDQRRLEQAAADAGYMAHLNSVLMGLHDYMTGATWFAEHYGDLKGQTIGYFSAEFGLHECLPIYSGGLGVLAGDHLKSASDLGLPLTAVGLFYRQGYFTQRLSSDGWQIEEYPYYDFHQMPVTIVKDDHGNPLRITVDVSGNSVAAQVWKVQVGRVNLYLLDADLPGNRAEDRQITYRLYGGDQDMRIRQEILLGIGGVRALDAMGVRPAVCHMNEGHSAFLSLERIRLVMERDRLSYDEAAEVVRASNVFTTHTPVPAGIDTFPIDLVRKYMEKYVNQMGCGWDRFLNLGRQGQNPKDQQEPFCMAVLALKLAGCSNGVSKRHGRVSREMFHKVWPGVPVNEVPIISITNGVHVRSWLSQDMAELFDRYMGPQWADNPVDREIWHRVRDIPDGEFWRTHERRKERLVAFVRRRLRDQLRRRGAPPADIKAADEVLDSDSLTIGFSRRFAPYKRGTLIFRNLERLGKLLTNPHRVVQVIFAGKAHPNDSLGKEMVKKVIQWASRPEFRRRLVFLEDYDINVARYLVQGVDVWLNNPLPPHEASGTSGMKCPPNGGINLSVLDGWWPEAYDGENGWSIGDGRIYSDVEYQDHVDSESIYDLLEKEVVPLYYDRGVDGIPRRWIQMMKASMSTISPVFNTNRMVAEYTEQLYAPAVRRWLLLTTDGYQRGKEFCAWSKHLSQDWGQVQILTIQTDEDDTAKELAVGDELTVRASVQLGTIKPQEVRVEVYTGRLDLDGEISDGCAVPMQCQGPADGEGTYAFVGKIPCQQAGPHGYAVRVVPCHPHQCHPYASGLIRWA
jgi:starch phosphorylase